MEVQTERYIFLGGGFSFINRTFLLSNLSKAYFQARFKFYLFQSKSLRIRDSKNV